MIEEMKQWLEALEIAVATCFDRYSHEQVMSRPEHFINQTITSLRQAIEVYESAPPEAQSEAEKTAFAFGWFKALKSQRKHQCKGIPRKGCDYLAGCDGLCNKCGEIHHHHQMVAQFTSTDEPDWKALVLNHNAECEARCDMDRCGYKPYFENNGRRCPDCPMHQKIEINPGIKENT